MSKAAKVTIVRDAAPPKPRAGRPMKYPQMAELNEGESLFIEGIDDLDLRRLRSTASQQKGRSYSISRLLDGRVQVYRVE